MNVTIRRIQQEDRTTWRVLWEGYNQFYHTSLPEDVTENTWRRFLDPASAIDCRVAVVEGAVVGFATTVLHEGTWVTSPVCYLEDLFVAPQLRGRGIARKLIQSIIDEGKQQGWSQVYWHTAHNNPARKLYDGFIPADDMVRYRINLS